MSATSANLRHIPQLDGMRATAILIVMVSHAGLEAFVPGGFGVTVFFFLSGYLITTLLRLEALSTGRVDLRGFYLRRTVRIVPPMLLAIAFVLLLQYAAALPARYTPGGLVADLAFLTNYAGEIGVSPAVQIPLWSLDVEEHFYIGFSTLFALFLARRSPYFGAIVCVAGCVVILGIRLAYAGAGGDLSQVFYWSHTRLDSILFGCVLALWNNPVLDERAWKPGLGSLLIAATLLLAAFLIRDEVFRQTLRYTLQGIGLFIVFSWILQLKERWHWPFTLWPVKWLGLLSYMLYLLHFPFLLAATHLGLEPAWLWGYPAAIGLSLLSYVAMERPLARWRRQFEKRLAKRPAATIPAQ